MHLEGVASPRVWRSALARPVVQFGIASLSPLPLVICGAVLGGYWALAGFLWITLVVFAADEVAERLWPADAPAEPRGREAGGADALSILLGGVHFGLLVLAVVTLARGGGGGFGAWILTFLSFGLWFGQVSNANAHELIHRGDRRLFRLGMWIFISLLFGHHTSAHRHVHHRFVATPDDPNTAEAGENFYAFAARAWPGALVAGYEMERLLSEAARAGTAGAGWTRRHNPYFVYLGGALAFVVGAFVLAGPGGVIVYLLLCAHAQLQIHLSDYVQHYGLVRRRLAMDRYEPVGAQHSWEAPHPVSGLMMLNAPRHGDHHAHPSRPYPGLELTKGAPRLPYSLPTMATLALIPPLWRKVMDRRLAALRRNAA